MTEVVLILKLPSVQCFPQNFRSYLAINLGDLVSVVWKTKTLLSFRYCEN